MYLLLCCVCCVLCAGMLLALLGTRQCWLQLWLQRLTREGVSAAAVLVCRLLCRVCSAAQTRRVLRGRLLSVHCVVLLQLPHAEV
jgi:hypothetical protein